LTYENIKSILLTFLVTASALLTWNLWTYQPITEELEKADTVREVTFSPTKKDVTEIVQPDQIIFHIDDRHYGTNSAEEMEKIIYEMSHWNLDHFESISSDEMTISSLVENHDLMEVLYPGSISINLYKGVLGIKDEDLLPFYFDQIMIDLESEQNDMSVIYFISREDQKIYKTATPSHKLSNFKEIYFEVAQQYKQYFPFSPNSGRTIYLPEKETEMMNYQYLYEPLESDKFKDALFSDPSLVQKSIIATGEEYTDGSSLLRENTDTNLISYIDPAEIGNQAINYNDLIKKSIDFVNGHGGWTDSYRFVGLDNDQKSVHFRLYGPEDYPIFSENSGISEIVLMWGKTDISRYIRNNFSFSFIATTSIKELDSGQSALAQLQKIEDYNSNLLQDLKIGYQMKLTQSLLIQLEPSWFYLYDGVWKQLTIEDSGGDINGLE
jgi:regulatory protein YycH of two-component signal transduction system YycFG